MDKPRFIRKEELGLKFFNMWRLGVLHFSNVLSVTFKSKLWIKDIIDFFFFWDVIDICPF